MLRLDKWSAAVAAAFCSAVGVSALIMGSFPVFLGPVSKDMGWGQAVFPRVITVLSLTTAVLLPITGRWVDRIGVRWPSVVGMLLIILGTFLLSLMQGVDVAYWSAALCLGAGAALAGPVVMAKVISSWFDVNRALALGIIMATVPMVSQAIAAPTVEWLINDIGWRSTYRALSAVVLVLGLGACLFFLKTKPGTDAVSRDAHLSQDTLAAMKRSTRRAYRSSAFWIITAAGCFTTATLIGFSIHMVNWLASRGSSSATAALLLSTLFISGIAGTFLSGYIVDRARTHRVLPIFYLVPLLGILLMSSTTTSGALVLGACFVGFGMSASSGLAPFLVVRYFGSRDSAEIFGASLAVTMLAIGVAPVLIGMGIDMTGGYTASIVGVEIVLALATVLIGVLGPYPATADSEGALTEEALRSSTR